MNAMHVVSAMGGGSPLKAEDILTVDELARRLKVGKAWIYEKSRARGQFGGEPLPTLRCGKYLRFEWPAVVEWLRRNRGR